MGLWTWVCGGPPSLQRVAGRDRASERERAARRRNMAAQGIMENTEIERERGTGMEEEEEKKGNLEKAKKKIKGEGFLMRVFFFSMAWVDQRLSARDQENYEI